MVYRILLVKANRFFRRPDEDFLFVAFRNEAVKKAVFLELLDFLEKELCGIPSFIEMSIML